jgi:predicted permease
MVQEILSVVAPVFVIAGVGYLWLKLDQPFDTQTISNLVMMIGTPCLVFSSLTRFELDAATFGTMALAAVCTIALSLIPAWAVLKLTKAPIPVYLPALSHPNTGNMGLPLVLLAFGDLGLALGISFFFINSISQFTVGMGISSGSFHPAQLIRQPIIWSVTLTLIVMLTGISVPGWLASTTQLLGGLVIPAMLLMLGTSLANLTLTDIRYTSFIAVFRLGLGVATGLAVIWLLDLEGTMAGVVLIQASMPAAVFNYVFAQRNNRDPEKVAGVILLSTLMSFATLPLLVAAAIRLAG